MKHIIRNMAITIVVSIHLLTSSSTVVATEETYEAVEKPASKVVSHISSDMVDIDNRSENLAERKKSDPFYISNHEIELMATIVMAEAEAEPEEGQRLVIDVILNRVDSPNFPNTVSEVIFQKNQFSPIDNGRFERCYAKPELIQLVIEEIYDRQNEDVIFFRTGRYSDYGEPLFQVCCHYFSKESDA